MPRGQDCSCGSTKKTPTGMVVRQLQGQVCAEQAPPCTCKPPAVAAPMEPTFLRACRSLAQALPLASASMRPRSYAVFDERLGACRLPRGCLGLVGLRYLPSTVRLVLRCIHNRMLGCLRITGGVGETIGRRSRHEPLNALILFLSHYGDRCFIAYSLQERTIGYAIL